MGVNAIVSEASQYRAQVTWKTHVRLQLHGQVEDGRFPRRSRGELDHHAFELAPFRVLPLLCADGGRGVIVLSLALVVTVLAILGLTNRTRGQSITCLPRPAALVPAGAVDLLDLH